MNIRESSAWLIAGVSIVLCSRIAYGSPAPCSLLTESQVSSVVGAKVGAGSAIANTGCSWSATTPKVMVTVSMQEMKMFEGMKSSSAPQGMTKSPVSGVGDEAIFVGAQGFSSLWVRKGGSVLLVRIYGIPPNDASAKLKTLATSAVSKL